ncbi:MAG: hypothetical protein H7843_09125 [Nitrospirota bacterium]
MMTKKDTLNQIIARHLSLFGCIPILQYDGWGYNLYAEEGLLTEEERLDYEYRQERVEEEKLKEKEKKLKADLNQYMPWPEMFFLSKTRKVKITVFCNFWDELKIRARLLDGDEGPIDDPIPYHILHEVEIELPHLAFAVSVSINDV